MALRRFAFDGDVDATAGVEIDPAVRVPQRGADSERRAVCGAGQYSVTMRVVAVQGNGVCVIVKRVVQDAFPSGSRGADPELSWLLGSNLNDMAPLARGLCHVNGWAAPVLRCVIGPCVAAQSKHVLL